MKKSQPESGCSCKRKKEQKQDSTIENAAKNASGAIERLLLRQHKTMMAHMRAKGGLGARGSTGETGYREL